MKMNPGKSGGVASRGCYRVERGETYEEILKEPRAEVLSYGTEATAG
jgi:hypothetical protein